MKVCKQLEDHQLFLITFRIRLYKLINDESRKPLSDIYRIIHVEGLKTYLRLILSGIIQHLITHSLYDFQNFVRSLIHYGSFKNFQLEKYQNSNFMRILLGMQQDIILRYMLDAKYAVLADILHNIQI